MKHLLMRLDRLIGRQSGLGRNAVREMLATGVVTVGGEPERDGRRAIGPFETVLAGETVIQEREARYVMLHKPAGILSATSDDEHTTVVDLIDEPWANELHLAGRLDRATTGLVILTNDGAFSESLTEPGAKVAKTYVVTTDLPVPDEAVAAFEAGMPFAKEGIVTQPAEVEKLSERVTRLTIYEGKHHQVKRMFARFDVRVTGLHRESVGRYHLTEDLSAGAYRTFEPITPDACEKE